MQAWNIILLDGDPFVRKSAFGVLVAMRGLAMLNIILFCASVTSGRIYINQRWYAH